jgi:predicted nucleic acid-binding protein
LIVEAALDSSALIGYLGGVDRRDTRLVHQFLSAGTAVLPPVVVTEVLSQPGLPEKVAALVSALEILPITDGFWERAGRTRARVIAKGRRARLADTLIAQACLDHDIPLITHNADFKRFAALVGLRLLP